ncbi:unnamed protein product [Caenorhabditis brenneri]
MKMNRWFIIGPLVLVLIGIIVFAIVATILSQIQNPEIKTEKSQKTEKVEIPASSQTTRKNPQNTQKHCRSHLLLNVLLVCQKSCMQPAEKILIGECESGKEHSEEEIISACCPE